MIQTFQYQNTPISFNLDGEVMINATEMAKPFGKETAKFLANQQTQDFINVLDAKRGIPSLRIQRGGNNPGTWMHQKLALKFAGWLSAEFELWVYDRVEELLTTGKTEIRKTPQSQSELILMMAQQNFENEKRLLAIEEKINEVEAKQIGSSSDYFSVAGFSRLRKQPIDSSKGSALSRKCWTMCQNLGYQRFNVHDPRFGSVWTYPREVLESIFNEHYPINAVA